MDAIYLGLIPYERALAEQARVLARGGGEVLGFEAEPVVTLGVRATAADVARVPAGFGVVRVDRGGQATLHNPGQLVIFPVVDTRVYGGARAWVCHLVRTTQKCAARLGQNLHYAEAAPGLYDDTGAKVVALGVRLRAGVSTHGLAINVRNDLGPFADIRACGRSRARIAHLATDLALPDLFAAWVKEFTVAPAPALKKSETRASALACVSPPSPAR